MNNLQECDSDYIEQNKLDSLFIVEGVFEEKRAVN